MFSCLRGEKEDAGPSRLKMVIVGDGSCGKTCLLHRFTHDKFFPRYIPTVFETETKTVYYKQKEVNLVMSDTAGQEDYDRLRPFSYDETDVVIVCFSLDSPDSLDNVLLNWVPEVRYFCGRVPLLLVGNKKDLRQAAHDTELVHTDPIGEADYDKPKKRLSKKMVAYEDGLTVASKMDAAAYFETSAKTGEGTEVVFEAVVRAGMEIKVKKRRELFRCFDGRKRDPSNRPP